MEQLGLETDLIPFEMKLITYEFCAKCPINLKRSITVSNRV